MENVKNCRISERPVSAISSEKALDVAQSFIEDLNFCIRKATQQHDINPISVYKILKQIKFQQYKINLMQELNDDDFDRRTEFYELMM